MLRRIALVSIASAAVTASLGSGGCSHSDPMSRPPAEAGPPSFTGEDASVVDPDAGLTLYCPATTCQEPFTTCTTSRFPCDVNLMTDPANCGSCGFRCESSGNGLVDCISGKCTVRCRAEWPSWTADCNGVLDDDCEVQFGTNDNCSACGEKCPDPAAPCIFDDTSGKGQCGCGAGKLYCGGGCVDPKTSDQHCSACDNPCDSSVADASAPPPHMHYGCVDSECGHLKCDDKYADCDGNLSNGCEAYLVSEAHCGACGFACDSGQSCKANRRGQPQCVCPPGKVLCEDLCVDIGTDPRNCGGCGFDCSQVGANAHGAALCNYGACSYICQQGWGDCNGDPKDGCEVNLLSDQLNCGACGNACDVLPGQPCLGGRCAVEPCGGGVPAR